jgi:alpha-tubulin suppressor-like RCC1 family protein
MTSVLPLGSGEKVTRLFIGPYIYFVLTDAHRVFVWGDNYCNVSGLGTTETDICEPTDLATHFHLPAGEYVVEISNLFETTVVLTNQGNLYYVGCHRYELMDMGTNPVEELTLISTDVVMVSNGYNFILAVRDEGRSVWILGHNDENYEGNAGGMGDGTNDPQPYFHDITAFLQLSEGEVIVQVVAITADEDALSSAAILTNRGRVFTFGAGMDGQLGDGGYGESAQGAYHSNLPIDITANLASTGMYVSSILFGDRSATEFEVIGEHLIRAIVPPGAELGYVDVTIDGLARQVITDGYEYITAICVR